MRDIMNRFDDEVEKILAYNNLIISMSKLPRWSEMSWNINQLYIFGFANDNLLTLQELSEYPSDIGMIFSFIDEAKEFLINYIDITNDIIKLIPEEIDMSEYFDDEFIMMVNEEFYDADYYDFIEIYKNDDSKENLITFFKKIYLKKFNRFEHIGPSKEIIDKIIEFDLKKIASNALRLYLEQVMNESEDVLVFIDKLKTTLFINDINNTLNANRQSFILLMSTFDATIFDMTKQLLEEHFYQYISDFCESDYKLKVKDFGKFANNQEMISNTVDECLKQKYLKDLIKIYKKLDVLNNKILFKNLMEISNRRNVHLHKSGVCDEQYITSFNLFSKNEGDFLEISENYLMNSIDYCSDIVKKIVEWYEMN